MKDVSKLSINHEQEQQEYKENHKDLDQKESSPNKTTRPKLTDVNKLSIGNHEQEQQEQQEQEQQEQKENHKDLAQKESSSDKIKCTRPRLLRRISDSGSSEMNPKMMKKIRHNKNL